MNERRDDHYRIRYANLCRDVVKTLGSEEGIKWLRGLGNLPKKSVARCEQIWALKKHQLGYDE